VEQLRIGEASRADVHALLGEPNRLASSKHEVWEFEYDPFHMYFIVGMGGPGGGGATDTPIYFGDETESRTRVAVEYDGEGKLAGWRWEGRTLEPVSLGEPERFRDHFSGTSEPEPMPAEPSRVVPWRAQAYALSPDGERAALMLLSRRIEIVEISAGHQVVTSGDWQAACGMGAIALGFAETAVVSLPVGPPRRRLLSGRGSLCLWREEAGELVADVSPAGDMARELERARKARLISRFVIVDREDGVVSVWDLSGASVTALGSYRFEYVAGSATISADGSLLAVERAVEHREPPTLVFHDVAGGTHRALTLPGPANRPQPLAALALAPKGALLAIHRWTHIEVWRLGTSDETPSLATALPLPPPTIAGTLGFSADGSRLVATSADFALVWETKDWRLIGRAISGAFANAPTSSGALELTPDGSHIATRAGLWRIAPQANHSLSGSDLGRLAEPTSGHFGTAFTGAQ
jgi:YD repeat-containing protein